MKTRRAYVELEYNGVNITHDLASDLKTFTYTDNAGGAADDVAIEISDAKRKWISNWMFDKGDTFTANIVTVNWRKDGEKKRLPCGFFVVDEPEYSGRPSVISLNGISVPASSNFMNLKRSKSWKNITIKAIASDIAARYKLQLFFDSKLNPSFKDKAQKDESDAAFLQKLCEDEGFSLKVTDKQIIVFREVEYEAKKVVATFREDDSSVTGYSFKTTYTNTAYAGVRLTYFDSKTKKTIKYLYATKEIDEEKDRIHKINRRVANEEEAERLAKNTLRKLNKKETQATLELVGDTRLLSSSTIDLIGFGSFDGKYYIDKAVHSLAGYKTTLELHKVLKGGY
ncbi:phage late control D family protein [Sporosarcina sp. FSL K6-1508]|uniref:phage late control D family protein n=1 Tax=Sporosarcina sp. FSL K6-1508 TaxID=2921553 RepID=UPI0030F717FF